MSVDVWSVEIAESVSAARIEVMSSICACIDTSGRTFARRRTRWFMFSMRCVFFVRKEDTASVRLSSALVSWKRFAFFSTEVRVKMMLSSCFCERSEERRTCEWYS